MKKEAFFGMGRTWMFVYLLAAVVSVGWLMGKISFQEWFMATASFGGLGTGKSTFQQFADRKKIEKALNN